MPDLVHTSVPSWASAAAIPDLDVEGRRFAVFAIGPAALELGRDWLEALESVVGPGRATLHQSAGFTEAEPVLEAELASAAVGWRLKLIGPADDCLALRARAVRAGLMDDEIQVASVDDRSRTVLCSHCTTRTTSDVGIGETVGCRGCGRNLLVYHHVSRRHGAYMGFMSDAEQA
ncbi:MAG: dimethylamine monooxygenase subunit DmmA family protein [Aeromicrobium sp.]